VSYGNIRDMIAAGVRSIAPASKTYVPARVLAGLDLDAATEVDYVSERDTGTPAGKRGDGGSWRTPWASPGHAGKIRCWPCDGCSCTPPPAHAAATARAKKLDRARETWTGWCGGWDRAITRMDSRDRVINQSGIPGFGPP
jgi:hypothetical protein